MTGSKVLKDLFILTLFLSSCDSVCKTKVNKREKAVLDFHNKYRRLHLDTPDLCYGRSDDKVKFSSQSWSEEMLRKNEIAHSDDTAGNYGENVWWGRNAVDAISAFNASVANWYREIENWNFTAGIKIDKNKDALHFTQVIWVGTTEVNCGYAYSPQKGGFVTCQYYRKGNYATVPARLKNVKPLRGKHVTEEVTSPTEAVINGVARITETRLTLTITLITFSTLYCRLLI